MRRSLRRTLASLGLGLALTATAVVAPAAPAQAYATDFWLGNSASFDGNAAARGTLLSAFLNGAITAEPPTAFPYPWPTSSPGGVRIEASCWGLTPLVPLQILFVGEWAPGKAQVNFYYPNAIGPAPWCADAGQSIITVYPAFEDDPIQKTFGMVSSHPGIFSVGDAPAGRHVATNTDLNTCNASLPGTNSCPVTIGGTGALLTLFLTGTEQFICNVPGAPACGSNIVFWLAAGLGGFWISQTLVSLDRTATPGVELATIRVTSFASAGTYLLRLSSVAPQTSPQTLTVELGPPA